MNPQDKSKRDLFAQLNNASTNHPTQPANQNRPSNMLSQPSNFQKGPTSSGGIIHYFPKGKKTAKGRGNSNFSENTIDRFFIDLLNSINQSQKGIRTKSEVLSSSELMRWLRQGLQEFVPSVEKNQEYENQYKGKPFLRLTIEEIGFGRATLSSSHYNQKVDLILENTIQLLSKQFGSSKWLVTKLLRRYLRQGVFYPSLYQAQYNKAIYKANTKVIDRYFKSPDSNVINQKSRQYQLLLVKCIELYQKQYESCINCIGQFLSFETQNIQDGEGLLARRTVQKPLALVLWENYCELSDNLLNVPQVPITNTADLELKKSRQKCKWIIQQKKTKIFLSLAQLFQIIANKHQRIQRDLAEKIRDFSEMAIKRIDEHICKIQSSNKINSQVVLLLVRQLTQLILAIFPWKTVQEQKNSNLFTKIKNVVSKTVSNPFKPIRIVIEAQPQNAQEIFMKISQQIQNGEWAIHSHQWKRWLGLFLSKFNRKIDRLSRFPMVLRHTIWLCKSIVKAQCDYFWQEQAKYKRRQMPQTNLVQEEGLQQNRVYLVQIIRFLEKVLQNNSSSFKGITLSQCFPILTCSLGYRHRSHISDALRFMKQSSFGAINMQIKHQITTSLSFQQRVLDKNTRIVYSQTQKQRNIQQQVKFLCRVVEIGTQAQLCILEQYLFEQFPSYTGFPVVIFLIKIFQRLSPETIHDIKCLRYTIKALDSIFINIETRKLLPIALGATQVGKWSCGKVIKAIVDVCSQTNGTSQILRQAKKLRQTFGEHINNILKISNSIHEYFPSGSRREDEKLYQRLEQLLKIQDYPRINLDFIQRNVLPLKYVPWLHTFLMILQSNHLTAIDLQNVHFLLLKMRVQSCTNKQFTNMQLIAQMMNNGNIQGFIARILTPTIITKSLSKKYLFGLSNSKLQSYISLPDALDNIFKTQSSSQTKLQQYINKAHSRKMYTKNQGQLANGSSLTAKVKYYSKQYRTSKHAEKKHKEASQIYCEISNSLRVIQTILRLSFQGEFQIVKKLNLYKWVKMSFFQKSHFFSVPFTVQLQSANNQAEAAQTKNKPTKLVSHELTTNINIIHTIASLLDFQARFRVPESQHPTHRMKLNRHYYYQVGHFNESLDSQTVERAQLNLLGDPLVKDNISISVLQIMQHLIHLNYQNKAYYCLTNRIYPQNKSMSDSSTARKTLEQFYLTIMNILVRKTISVRTRQVCLSFLCSCMKSNKFSEYLRTRAFNFKDPLTVSLSFLLQDGGIAVISKLLLFFNLMLSDKPQNEDILFVKSCLNEVTGFGDSLANFIQAKIREATSVPMNYNPYSDFAWSKSVQQIIACKMSLLLYIALLSIFINTQSHYLVPNMIQWLLRQSEICTQAVGSISFKDADILEINAVKKIEQTFSKSNEKGYLEFTKNLHEWILFEGQGSLGEDFVCRRWQAYHKALEKEDAQAIYFAFLALRINNQYSLQMVQEALSQLYYTVLLGLFQKGKHGYYFIQGQLEYNQKMAFSISPKGERSPNCISGTEMITDSQENMRKLFLMIKNTISQIWKQKQQKISQVSKNNGILLLSQIFKTINRCYSLEPIAWRMFNSDTIRVLKKIEQNLWSNHAKLAHQNANVCLLQSMLQLSNNIYAKDLVTGIPESIKSYLTIICIHFQNSLQKMALQSILKLGILVQQLQIRILLQIEPNNKIFRSYLNYPEHSYLISHIKSCMKVALTTIQDKSASDGIRSLSILIFTKAIQISSLIKDYEPESIHRQFSHRLGTRLQIMAADQGQEQMLTELFVLSFLAQATASNSSEWMRMVVRILRGNGGKLISRVGTCGLAQSLWYLVQNKLILHTLVNISSAQQWISKQIGSLLTEFFLLFQQNIHKFLVSRVTPANQIQHQIASRIIFRGDTYEKTNYYGSIFAILVELRMHENIRYFMLFMLSAFINCPLIAEFCQKTITLGQLEEHTWQRIKLTFEHISDFIAKFLQSLIQFSQELVDVSVSVSTESSFASIPLRAFFETFQTERELIEDSIQTIIVFAECVCTFVGIWKSYDWKSRLDWKASRIAFLSKSINMVSKWKQISKKADSEQVIKEKLQKMSFLLNDCHDAE